MRIFAIETSCDETAMAMVEGEGDALRVTHSLVRSQIDIHQEYGGVVPEVAAREHLEIIAPMLNQMVRPDGFGIDALAVTYGPGLAPALRVGVEMAKTLAWVWQKPLVPICHLEGHIYASWIETTPVFPVLALIVSGGHTELVLMKNHGVFERLGETLDDAAGEAFDKVAKMLELPYPGGPAVAKLALSGKKDAYIFPRALCDRSDFMFSFAGVKTAVLYELRRHADVRENAELRADIAASFQEAVVDALVQKTFRAVGKYSPRSLILAGGVAANLALRERFQSEARHVGVPVYLPPFAYTLDNAAMIGAAGYYRYRQGVFVDPRTVAVDPNLDI